MIGSTLLNMFLLFHNFLILIPKNLNNPRSEREITVLFDKNNPELNTYKNFFLLQLLCYLLTGYYEYYYINQTKIIHQFARKLVTESCNFVKRFLLIEQRNCNFKLYSNSPIEHLSSSTLPGTR